MASRASNRNSLPADVKEIVAPPFCGYLTCCLQKINIGMTIATTDELCVTLMLRNSTLAPVMSNAEACRRYDGGGKMSER